MNYPVSAGVGPPTSDRNAKACDSLDATYEKEHRIVTSKSIIKEKIKQFKLGKYTDKYIRTYLEFVLMEGIIDNLTYLEHLKKIGEKV